MILNRIIVTTSMTSGAAASATALTFTPSNSPMKIVRFYGTMGSFVSTVSGNVNVIADTGELIYQSATVAPTAAFNQAVDCDVFPGDTVVLTTTGDIASTPKAVTLKIQLEK